MILALMKYFICNFTKTFVFLLTLPLTFCHLLHLSHWHNGWQRSCSECGRSPESSSSSSSSLEPSLNRTCQIREKFQTIEPLATRCPSLLNTGNPLAEGALVKVKGGVVSQFTISNQRLGSMQPSWLFPELITRCKCVWLNSESFNQHFTLLSKLGWKIASGSLSINIASWLLSLSKIAIVNSEVTWAKLVTLRGYFRSLFWSVKMRSPD